MSNELVFTVEGATAIPASQISLAEAGLLERDHLQEWILAHPQILGDDVLIVTFEFDRWRSHNGQSERDRLDVLGLDGAGRLVVGELKRGISPDTVEMQAIKYAAMASRFTPEILASQHARFRTARGLPTTDQEALDLLSEHVESELSVESLRRPRIALVAADFPAAVTASVVWLTEMGLDISLIKFVAYRTARETIVTVSRIYPVQDVEEFTVAPLAARHAQLTSAYPEIDWTTADLKSLQDRANSTTLAALRLCSTRPGDWISLREIEQEARRSAAEARADLGGLTNIVKRRFGRSNRPFENQWAAGGEQQFYYRMAPEIAERWREAENGTHEVPATRPTRSGL
jgi:hypothetical protein